VKTIGTLVAALVCVAVLVAPSAGGGQSWRALRMSRLGAAIDLPASWQDFSRRSPALRRRLRAIERENPTLAPYIRSLRVRGAIGFIAVDLDRPSAGRDFLTNLNVIHQAAPGATLAAVRRALLQELRATGSVRGQIATRVVRTRAGNALEARYVFRSSLSGVTVASAATQYLVVRKGTLFVLTYSTAPRERGHYRSVFERSARSFRFG
jgi:hypothetical protein